MGASYRNLQHIACHSVLGAGHRASGRVVCAAQRYLHWKAAPIRKSELPRRILERSLPVVDPNRRIFIDAPEGTRDQFNNVEMRARMPSKNEDLHGFVPDTSTVALLLIDVINAMEFERLGYSKQSLPMAQHLSRLKRHRRSTSPCARRICQRQLRALAIGSRCHHSPCSTGTAPGKPVVELLQPGMMITSSLSRNTPGSTPQTSRRVWPTRK